MANKKFSDYVVAGDNITLTYDNNADTVTIDAAGNVDSVNGKVGVVVLTKTDIGLGNVDNTSDANKPISTATQTALNGKQNTLVSGTNIKTVNSNSLVGSGDVVIDKTSVGLGNVANVDTTNASNISSGTLSDSRLSTNVTTQGNTFNAANKLVQLDGTAKLPAIDGSQLTNLPSFTPPNGLLKIASAISTTFQAVTDYLGNASVLFLNSRRVGIGKDTSVTTQSVAVVEVQDANTSIVLKPNGTGAIIANVPDGTATGGNARGQYATDFQKSRTGASQIASGNYSFIGSGQNSQASGLGSFIGSGIGNYATNSYSAVISGAGNNSTGSNSFIGAGQANNCGGDGSVVTGGYSNTVSAGYGVVSGGQSNTASTNTHATVVGGQSNTSSGQHSVSGGWSNQSTANRSIAFGEGNISSANQSTSFGGYNTASGERSFAVGSNNTANAIRSSSVGGLSNTASGQYSITLGGTSNSSSGISSLTFGQSNNARQLAAFAGGLNANSYLYSQFSLSSGQFNSSQLSQFTILHPRREALLTSGQTIELSLDGTGLTNLITTYNNKGIWNITANWCAIVTSITGTATGINLGDSITQNNTFAFKHYGGSASILGSVNTLSTNTDTSMNTSLITFSASGANTLNISFTAPTFVGGGSVNIQVLCNLIITQVQLP